MSILHLHARLSIRKFARDGSITNYGVVSTRIITDVFREQLVQALLGTATGFDTFKYHEYGTDSTVASESDTALGAPTGEAREAGTQDTGADVYTYKSVATHVFAGTYSLVEHGLFNSDGLLLDRSTYDAIDVVSGDRVESTYELTTVAME